MNDQEKIHFDKVLKSKLDNHLIEPNRDLMPGILEKIEGGAAGGSSGLSKFWPFIILGIALIGTLAYMQYDQGISDKPDRDTNTTGQSITNTNNSLNTENNKKEEINQTNSIALSSVNKAQANFDNQNNKDAKDSFQNNIDPKEEEMRQVLSQGAKNISKDSRKDQAVNQINSSKEKKISATVAPRSSSNLEIEQNQSSSLMGDQTADNDNGLEKEAIVLKNVEIEVGSNSDSSAKTKKSSSKLKDDRTEDKMASSPEELSETSLATEENFRSTVANNSNNNSSSNTTSSDNTIDVEQNESFGPTVSSSKDEQFSSLENPMDSDQSKTKILPEASDNVIVSDDSTNIDSLPLDSTQNNDMERTTLPVIRDNKWSIDIMAGPSYNYRILDFAGNRELENHKNEFESSIVTYSYAINVRRKLTNNFSANLGLMYLEMGEKYEFSNGVVSHSAVNEYNYLSIPLSVDYNILKRNKTNLIFGLGAQMNFLQKGTSSWLDPQSFDAQTHSNSDPSSPFSEQTFAWNAKVGIRYELSPRLDIILEEQGLLFNNSVYKKETGLVQKEYSFRTFIGIAIKL